jgi:O-antigen/teichoic acid export membrane protein
VFVILFPEVLIRFLAGEQYLGAVPYLRILMVISIFLCFLKQFGTIIDSTGNPKINFRFTTFIAVINIISCYFCIKAFGFIGAAYGLIITHVIAFCISQYILQKLYQVQFFNSFRYAFHFYFETGKTIFKKIALS